VLHWCSNWAGGRWQTGPTRAACAIYAIGFSLLVIGAWYIRVHSTYIQVQRV
jgi:hypothetical protein